MTQARDESSGPDGRRIAALLANAEIRAVWARFALGAGEAEATAGVKPARASKVLASLTEAGLLESGPDGFVASESVFARLLAQWPTPERPSGVDRFLRDGRIDRYPATATDRRELLQWVVERAIGADEVLDENAVNNRLEPFDPDVARLRRHLVDAGLLLRTPSGSSYSRS